MWCPPERHADSADNVAAGSDGSSGTGVVSGHAADRSGPAPPRRRGARRERGHGVAGRRALRVELRPRGGLHLADPLDDGAGRDLRAGTRRHRGRTHRARSRRRDPDPGVRAADGRRRLPLDPRRRVHDGEPSQQRPDQLAGGAALRRGGREPRVPHGPRARVAGRPRRLRGRRAVDPGARSRRARSRLGPPARRRRERGRPHRGRHHAAPAATVTTPWHVSAAPTSTAGSTTSRARRAACCRHPRTTCWRRPAAGRARLPAGTSRRSHPTRSAGPTRRRCTRTSATSAPPCSPWAPATRCSTTASSWPRAGSLAGNDTELAVYPHGPHGLTGSPTEIGRRGQAKVEDFLRTRAKA